MLSGKETYKMFPSLRCLACAATLTFALVGGPSLAAPAGMPSKADAALLNATPGDLVGLEVVSPQGYPIGVVRAVMRDAEDGDPRIVVAREQDELFADKDEDETDDASADTPEETPAADDLILLATDVMMGSDQLILMGVPYSQRNGDARSEELEPMKQAQRLGDDAAARRTPKGEEVAGDGSAD